MPVCGKFPEEESLLGYHSAQSPTCVWVASPGHDVGQFKVKCSLCSAQEVCWSLHWLLRPGWAGGFRGLWFCVMQEY